MSQRSVDQDSPDIETLANLQRSLTATLSYIMGRASVADLFRLHAYLSARAAEMVQGEGSPVRDDSWEQELERRRQQEMYQKALAQQAAGQYRQES